MRQTQSLVSAKGLGPTNEPCPKTTKRIVLVKDVTTQKPSLKSIHASAPSFSTPLGTTYAEMSSRDYKVGIETKSTAKAKTTRINNTEPKYDASFNRFSSLLGRSETKKNISAKASVTSRHSMLASPEDFLEKKLPERQSRVELAFGTKGFGFSEKKSAQKIIRDPISTGTEPSNSFQVGENKQEVTKPNDSNVINVRNSKSARKIDSGRPNVLKGGLEPRNVKPTILSCVSNSGDCLPPSLLQRRLSDKILAHRTKFLKDCQTDFCTSSTESQSLHLQHPLLEDGKKVLRKTQRVTQTSLKSGATKKMLEKLTQNLARKTADHKSSGLAITESKFRRNPTSINETSTSEIVQVKPSLSFNLPFRNKNDSKSPGKIETSAETLNVSKMCTSLKDIKYLTSDLSRIQLSAATIKDVMGDPLVIQEDGILSQIANPRNDITPKTLAKLLGESEQASMHTLKQKIIQKANKSQSLVPSGTSVTTGQTESESLTFSELDNIPSEDLSLEINSREVKNRKKEKPGKKKKRKKKQAKNVSCLSTFQLSQNSLIDSQLQECLQRQEKLESQVSNFIEKMRAKSCSALQSNSDETLDTLEALVKTQKEIINIQIDLRKRYGIGISPTLAVHQSSTIMAGKKLPRPSAGSEPILNPYNLHYGQLASYAKEINGNIAFYCSACDVACENEMKFRLHLESASHVSKAYKVMQESQPLYNCDDCKTKIQGTTQFLAHVTGKKHIRNTKSNINLAMNMLENKVSVPKTPVKIMNGKRN